ncbi:MAG: ribulose 1,5-bisphosphate carboxylase large subunit [Proteobacteria bacterium]|nr:MAG: ribulose 1,5-bisphosphate carboxylase large subunit [Pseudomonadota bacterium]
MSEVSAVSDYRLPADSGGLELSGERFAVAYRISADDEASAKARAEELCVEQTVEFPADLLPTGAIPEQIVGRLETLAEIDVAADEQPAFLAEISYAAEIAGGELTQLLNVIFGNSSLKRGLRVESLKLSPSLAERFRGPRFGRPGLRELCGAIGRPLLATALKPMGLSSTELAALAAAYAEGGIDLIKDDHGLADQPFCRFEERAQRCAEAVAEANAKTGGESRYVVNISFDAEHLPSRAGYARGVGVSGFLAAPGLLGFATVKRLADDDALGLPVLAHPAFLGSFVVYRDAGIAPGLIFGTLPRLAGCDVSIFPNHGGRFGFNEDDCQSIASACGDELGRFAPIFPAPAGGMRLDHVSELVGAYGEESVLLIGGDLHRGDDVVARCREFRALVASS